MRPTHKQSAVLTINPDGLEKAKLKSFCLSSTGDIFAACAVKGAGEVRMLSASGEHLKSWPLPVKPEAINFGSNGDVYVAGGGKLMRLGVDGETLLSVDAPHITKMMGNKDAVRKQVVDGHKRSVKQYKRMLSRYEEMVTKADERLEKAQERLAEAEAAEAEEDADEALLVRLRRAVTNQERQKESAVRVLEQMEEMLGDQAKESELTEEQIEERVRASIEYASRVAAISESDGRVFITTGSPEGHGFAVWRMNGEFAEAETVVDGLRGCCGQMDVQACQDGLFVAENSRKRVCRYDLDGEMITTWGSSARKGVKGFGSCCNPMNVAFGPESSVYTAESSSGRIKRYDADGKLLDLVGSVELVPGCKKVSIAVGPSGDRVYMLDITRDHIVMMERLSEEERAELPGQEVDPGENRDAPVADSEAAEEAEQAAAVGDKGSPLTAVLRALVGLASSK